ncbi:hypothetical protein HNY73_008545 [Argiope bruennichi]|uniref:Uncharacterized protein n=1 Tax=Argiope bruennichi TaxID=94029 RepID=A0A8T0FC24_ARGBR|nr:hypothetical protein HNY73_008545 [Argiope bruennichi]
MTVHAGQTPLSACTRLTRAANRNNKCRQTSSGKAAAAAIGLYLHRFQNKERKRRRSVGYGVVGTSRLFISPQRKCELKADRLYFDSRFKVNSQLRSPFFLRSIVLYGDRSGWNVSLFDERRSVGCNGATGNYHLVYVWTKQVTSKL